MESFLWLMHMLSLIWCATNEWPLQIYLSALKYGKIPLVVRKQMYKIILYLVLKGYYSFHIFFRLYKWFYKSTRWSKNSLSLTYVDYLEILGW